MNTPEIMNIEELAEYLKVSTSSLYKLAQRGDVPGQKVGKHWRFRKETIDRWLDKQSQLNADTKSQKGAQ